MNEGLGFDWRRREGCEGERESPFLAIFECLWGSGCAWLDVGGRFMRFLVADTKNVKAFEIYPLLDGLSQQLKEAGYLMSDDKDEVMGL